MSSPVSLCPRVTVCFTLRTSERLSENLLTNGAITKASTSASPMQMSPRTVLFFMVDLLSDGWYKKNTSLFHGGVFDSVNMG